MPLEGLGSHTVMVCKKMWPLMHFMPWLTMGGEGASLR